MSCLENTFKYNWKEPSSENKKMLNTKKNKSLNAIIFGVLMTQKINNYLIEFGLSPNQVEVYSILLKHKFNKVTQIQKHTSIHSQDIYKILRKLEKKGLIMITHNKPLTIEVIPIKYSLNKLLSSKKEATFKKIHKMEKNISIIQKIIEKEPATPPIKETKEKVYVFKGMTPSRLAKIDQSFQNTKSQYDLVVKDGQFTWLAYLKEAFKVLSKNKIKTRILILSNSSNFTLPPKFEKIMPNNLSYEIRKCECKEALTFVIIDLKEVWIPSESDETLLITDSKTVISMGKMAFDFLWFISSKHSQNEFKVKTKKIKQSA